ncbi:conserved exported protein of unknown function [Tenacibaculum sp. 190524A02b]|uniref:hypothetical protein n=1 Tax=Tenacibaculum vairaonense TaxID=3137860 RepID=UPI0032B27FF2
MKNVLRSLLLILTFSLISCGGNDDNIKEPATLRVTVTQSLLNGGAKVNNATVLLYKSIEDLKSNKNKVAAGVTNEEGIVVFNSGLEYNTDYYLDVESGCISNYLSIALESTGDYVANITEGVGIVDFSVQADETNAVVIENATNNGYMVKLYDVEIGIIKANETITLDYIPTYWSIVSFIDTATGEELSSIDNDIKSVCGETKKYVIN